LLTISIAASLARKIYLRPGSGIGGFRKAYGGAEKREQKRRHCRLASGSVIRKAVQALESMNIVEKAQDGGRRISVNGQRELDRAAAVALGKK